MTEVDKGIPKEEEIKAEDAKASEPKDEPKVETEKTEPVDSAKPSNDDNILNAVAHAMILFLPVIAPLLIWIIYKDKSESVKFQSMQAMIFQFIVTTIFIMLVMVGTILSFLLLPILLIFVGIAVWCIGVLYGLWGAYKCFTKAEFKYVLIGDMVDKHC